MNLYVYKAVVTDVYDGDTITVDIDLGFGTWMKNQKLRLYGINTPEVRGDSREEGIKVRDYVRDMILNKEVLIKTHKDKKGKFGRWLAEILIPEENYLLDLNDLLIRQGMAILYMVD